MSERQPPQGFADAEMDVDSAARTLAAEPGSPLAWHRLGLALALGGETGELLSLAQRAGPRFGDSVIFVHNVVKDLALREAWEQVGRLARALPAHTREHAVALYYAGCAEVAAGRHLAALEWFERFKQSVLPRHAQFPLGEAAFNLIFRQGILVESPATVRAVAAGPRPATPPAALVGGVPDTEAPFAVAHVVDARYFRRFAGELCAGHLAAGLTAPLHFHVAASDARIAGEMEELRRAHPGLALGFSHEAPGPWDHPVYYTCARFMVLERLLDWYGRTVITSDADILPTVALERVFEAARGADFACFETGRHEPASVYQASIMAFGTHGRTRAFVADLVKFCAAKLQLPPALSWMLDQAALFSVLTQRAVDDPDFAYRALNGGLGLDMKAAVRQLSTEEEKLGIMRRQDPS